MKFGLRTPSLKKSISARTTGRATRAVKRALIPGYGKKGMGWLNPKRALYNRAYSRTTFSLFNPPKGRSTGKGCAVAILLYLTIAVTAAAIVIQLTTTKPMKMAKVSESNVPVSTYSDFSRPDEASLNRRIDLAATRKPIAAHCDSTTNTSTKVLSTSLFTCFIN